MATTKKVRVARAANALGLESSSVSSEPDLERGWLCSSPSRQSRPYLSRGAVK